MSDDKRKMFETIFAKLQKILPHLGDENANEAGVALRKINTLLRSVKLDWHDLFALMSEREELLLGILLKLSGKDADALVQLGRKGATFLRSTTEQAFADVMISGHRVTMPLAAEFSDWLLYRFYLDRNKAPTAGALKSALRTLSAHARFEGEQHEVHLRTAAIDGKIYIDLGDPEWHIVEIDGHGWRVLDDAPVRFRRTAGMKALPLPQRGGSINQLRRFVNVDDGAFVLIVAAMTDALRPELPHPVVCLAGEEGTAKTTLLVIMRRLVDPSSVPASALVKTRDLFVQADGALMLAFDNISSISPDISDALCMIATGSGVIRRKLFTDSELVLIGGSRSIILTSLTNPIQRSDLADRAVVLPLLKMKPESRRALDEFWRDFESERPVIFGALLDVVAHALKQLPRVRLSRAPRMADFAKWGIACESAFAKPGAFLAAFEAHAADAREAVIENDPVAVAIAAFMHERDFWRGTITRLLSELTVRDPAESQPSAAKSWPRDSPAFGKALRRLSAVLRKDGIEIVFNERTKDRRRDRIVELLRINVEPAGQAADSADGTDSADSSSRTLAKVIAMR